jgi:hypothetical protein
VNEFAGLLVNLGGELGIERTETLEEDPALGLQFSLLEGLPRPMIGFEGFSSFSLGQEQQTRNGRVIMPIDMSMDYVVAELSACVRVLGATLIFVQAK